MKQTILFAILIIGITLSGCADTSTPTDANKDTPKTTEKQPDKADSTPEKKEEAKEEEKATSDLKPEDIDLEKPVSATELNTAALANMDAWKGKEVAIVGKYSATTTSQVQGKDRIRIDIADEKTNKKVAGCVVEKKAPEEIAKQREGRVFKGKVLEERYGRVLLEPCEFVK